MVKIDIQKTNITIAGNWNVAILTPEWIEEEFPDFWTGEKIPMEIGINIRDIRYEMKDLLINPRPDRLIISPKNETKECFDDLISLAGGILEKLSHTPIIAVGSNFAFVLDESDDISHVCGDNEKLHDHYNMIGKKYSGISVIQHVLTENDKQVTISYNLSINTKMVTFNYNRNTTNKDEVKGFVNDFKNHFVDAKNIIDKLLR